MSDYTKTTDFAAKDSLPSGDPGKVAKGSEVDTEFDNIETAIATKANKTIPAVTNNVAELDANGDLVDSGVTDTELSILDGALLTTAELNVLAGATSDNDTANKAAILSGAGDLTLNPASGNARLYLKENGTDRAIVLYNATNDDLEVYTTNAGGTHAKVASFEGEKNNAGLYLNNDAPATPVANVLYQDNIPKAWGHINTTTPSINNDFNVSSVASGGSSRTSVTFATSMANNTFAAPAIVNDTANGNSAYIYVYSTGTGSVGFQVRAPDSDIDTQFGFVVFGDQ